MPGEGHVIGTCDVKGELVIGKSLDEVRRLLGRPDAGGVGSPDDYYLGSYDRGEWEIGRDYLQLEFKDNVCVDARATLKGFRLVR